MTFLDNSEFSMRPLKLNIQGLSPIGLFLGKGSQGLEVAVLSSPSIPTAGALHKAFKDRNMAATVFCVGKALEKHPSVGEAMKKLDWEIASHGYRWLDYQNIPEDIEKEQSFGLFA